LHDVLLITKQNLQTMKSQQIIPRDTPWSPSKAQSSPITRKLLQQNTSTQTNSSSWRQFAIQVQVQVHVQCKCKYKCKYKYSLPKLCRYKCIQVQVQGAIIPNQVK
jgi:hypothetical protein